MLKNWKQFGVWGMLFGNDMFSRARLRLTLLYVLIITVILFIFSQTLLVGYSRYLEGSLDRNEISESQEAYIIKEAEGNLQTTLLIINAGILVFTAGLGYFLAGRTLRPIKKTLENQKQFLSDASHELRTPLSVLKTNMEVELSGRRLNKEQRTNLKSNLEEVDTMARLVNDLLLLSRLDSKEGTVRNDVISLQEVMKTVKKRMSVYARKKRVTIQSKKTEEAPLLVIGDKELLISAFSNLVKNAADYNKVNGKVAIAVTREEERVHINIEDTGVGIPEDKLPHIFERFYRGDKSREGYVEGSGLGLPITKAIIDSHGGKIWVVSKVGEGTTMHIQLPLADAS